MESALYVVATPIGNLGDMVPRAVEILQSVDLIAAEDTRHSARLFQHFSIDTPCFAYHDHSGDAELRRISTCIDGGGSVALISDAGTPLISDPGYRLLQHAHQSGWRVIPVPGASAIVAALSVAGLPTDSFLFGGFLPARQVARCNRLQQLAQQSSTLVFYEAPHRLLESLRDMVNSFGDERMAVLARELTKTFETVLRAPLAELLTMVEADANQQRGEIVLLVAGAPEIAGTLDEEAQRLLELLAPELPPKKVAAIVAAYTGVPKKELYNFLIAQTE
jgi:16S rRNA (cytidine1402-2'-O)-methyltransferase